MEKVELVRFVFINYSRGYVGFLKQNALLFRMFEMTSVL